MPNWVRPLPVYWKKSTKPGGVFEDAAFAQRITETEARIAEPDFWNNPEAAEKTISTLKSLKTRYEPWKALRDEALDLQTLFELATEVKDEGETAGIEDTLESLTAKYEKQNVFELM